MIVQKTVIAWQVKHRIYGILSEISISGNEFIKHGPGKLFFNKEELNSYKFEDEYEIEEVNVSRIKCFHKYFKPIKLNHGGNKGKWVAECQECGLRSSGKPKSSSEQAIVNLKKNPTDKWVYTKDIEILSEDGMFNE